MKHLSELKSRAADAHTPAFQVASGAVVKKKARVTYDVTLALGIGRKGYFNPFPGFLIGYDETRLCDRESVELFDVTDEQASFGIKRLQFHHNLGGTRTTAWDGA
jgi:hypothetical protein